MPRTRFFRAFAPLLLAGTIPMAGNAAPQSGTPNPRGPVAKTWEEAYARLKPLNAPRRPNSVDPSTLDGKVVTGYQGWFFAEGDGSGKGWAHFGGRIFKPGVATIDMWPDMSEASPGERYPTEFRHADGSVATVFSSYNPKTVDRHFRWMAQYGIDGAFLQRFGSELRQPASYDAVNAVMENVRRAANANGRTWSVMYDLSGLRAGEIDSVVKEDWKRLVDKARITRDAAYQHHRGKPVVTIWGVGFNENRPYSLEECASLVDFLKNDPVYGGNTVMLGVPYYWLAQTGDAIKGDDFHELLKKVDIISPWSVGRYRSTPDFERKIAQVVKPDIAWCKENHLDYMPVIFPGFQWKNLQINRHQNPQSDLIPREGGAFFWSQGSGLITSGARMLYVAMFDEIDEGTAIFKVTNDPPVGESEFGTYGGQPSDRYLWLAGQLSQALKKHSVPPTAPPKR